jgi:hypothetical protein
MNRTIELSIPTPCSQNWDEMSMNEKGRFCDSCKKLVIDFTHYSDQQLADFFKSSKGNVCGKLRNDQLHKSLHPAQQTNNYSIPKFLVSAALTIGFGNNVNADEKHMEAIHVVANEEKEAEKNNSIAGADSTRIISGTILDMKTKETIPGATILLEGDTVATSTNMNGFFSIDISSRLHADTIKLIISSVGYSTKVLKYSPEHFPSKLTIELTEDAQLILTSVGGIGYWKPTLWQRLKYRFRKIINHA